MREYGKAMLNSEPKLRAVFDGLTAKSGTVLVIVDVPWLVLADDAAGEDRLSGWSTGADADALAAGWPPGSSVRRCVG
ncbi:hypothetical protein ACFV7Q_30885 [Streptomyces sp. NPDC059851]|uniref:hypothetical protein n=1 Tax=Streptomyces sp. NPDC059851 TaxID=3346971 RepID=UPI00365CD73D